MTPPSPAPNRPPSSPADLPPAHRRHRNRATSVPNRTARPRARIQSLFLSLALPLALLPTPASPQDTLPAPTFALTGQVIDALSGAPVISAVIKVPELRRYVFADVNGRFRFPDFPAGTWEIVVEMLGYHTIDGAVTVTEGNGLVLQMRPDPVAIEEIVVRTRAEGLLYERRRRFPLRVTTITEREINDAINPDPVAIFKNNVTSAIMGCDDRFGDWAYGGCYWDGRKGSMRVSVYLNENRLLGGVNELSAVPAYQIHSMDWVEATGQLRVYTHWFIKRLNETRIGLEPWMVPMG